MSRARCTATGDLLGDTGHAEPAREALAEGATLLRCFARAHETALMNDLQQVLAVSAFRYMYVPGGHRMSVAMTNAGDAGWLSDTSGYRYDAIDPATTRPWPRMPASFLDVAIHASASAGYGGFAPDSCLINCYEPGARLTLHQDKNERDYTAPIVSVSLGLPAVFLFGGPRRSDRPRRIALTSGDVAVWGGPARLLYHGVAPLADGAHPLTGRCRINLTFRKAL
jgi:alkylated DNA repair protein (DNA oxidative demethylase)